MHEKVSCESYPPALPWSPARCVLCCSCCPVRIQMALLSGDDESCLLQLAQLVAAALGCPSLAASLQPPRYCAC